MIDAGARRKAPTLAKPDDSPRRNVYASARFATAAVICAALAGKKRVVTSVLPCKATGPEATFPPTRYESGQRVTRAKVRDRPANRAVIPGSPWQSPKANGEKAGRA